MTDITNPRLLYFKGGLFLLAGLVAAILLVLEHPSVKRSQEAQAGELDEKK